ncbi:MAG: putative metal-binding motif-containing protein [Flavobacteriales bacterium]|nr:putative metal-binding motif-containing protein [Flavobacteriales bacterium]
MRHLRGGVPVLRGHLLPRMPDGPEQHSVHPMPTGRRMRRRLMACSACRMPMETGASAPFDCNDNNATVYPDAPEGCTIDGLDNDCDGSIDEDALVDADNDGFTLCTGDCNDTDDTINPNGTEVCDGADNDCDGIIDEGFPARYADTDGDGFGDPNNPSSCNDPTSTTDNTDCDDADPTVYPTAPEICDGLDNDCNGTVDDNQAEDNDNDGFTPCTGDCDDANDTVFPGAPELCDGLDNDCNGAIELSIDAYPDGDGFGDAANSSSLVAQPVRRTTTIATIPSAGDASSRLVRGCGWRWVWSIRCADRQLYSTHGRCRQQL